MDVTLYFSGVLALLPEILVSVGVVGLLLWDAFAGEGGLGRKAPYAALGILALALVASLFVSTDKQTLFSGMVVIDPFTQFFRVLALLAGAIGVGLAMGSSEVMGRRAAEYFSLFLALIVGMVLMAASSDLLMIYVAIELVSLMSYVLAGFVRKDKKSAEAALKYVIYGGAASGVMLVGFSLLYGLTGTTQLSLINERVMAIGRESMIAGLSAQDAAVVPVALTAGLVLSFCGFAYKIAAVPLHMWSPDVYEGAPTPFTAFLSTGPKAAGFAALLRFFVVGFSDGAHFVDDELLSEVTRLPWPYLIVIVSILTMTIGNFAAIGQSNIKRFLAYSSIAHAGYSLIGLAAFSRTGASSVLLYMVFYLLMNMGAFFCVIWVRERLGSDRIDDYKGLGYRAPMIAIPLTICLFSLTGLPPFAGFIGKFYLFSAALDRGASIETLAICGSGALGFMDQLRCTFGGASPFYWLGVIAALNSAVSLYYYARVVRKMFLERPDDESPLEVDFGAKALLGPVAAILVVGGIYWAPLWNAAQRAIDFQRPTIAEVEIQQKTPSQAKLEARGAETTAKLE